MNFPYSVTHAFSNLLNSILASFSKTSTCFYNTVITRQVNCQILLDISTTIGVEILDFLLEL
jgi:hypothetical protein